MDANFALLSVVVMFAEMDPNLATLLGLIVTSVTTILITLINVWKSIRIERKVDAGNAVTDSVHVIANGRTDALLKLVEEKNKEIQRLSLLVPPPAPSEVSHE